MIINSFKYSSFYSKPTRVLNQKASTILHLRPVFCKRPTNSARRFSSQLIKKYWFQSIMPLKSCHFHDNKGLENFLPILIRLGGLQVVYFQNGILKKKPSRKKTKPKKGPQRASRLVTNNLCFYIQSYQIFIKKHSSNGFGVER